MPHFSQRSLNNLKSVHQDLQTVLHYAIKETDFTVIFGYRTAETQFDLFKRGREKVDGIWIITNKKKVVTYKDGYHKKSRHQLRLAADLVPYHKKYPHIRWDDREAFHYLAGRIMGVAQMLKRYDAIDNVIEWGGNFRNFKDLPHFQIK